jgi:hypothetical protein
MRLWFNRRKRTAGADAPGSARGRLRAAHGARSHPKRHFGPPPEDPIKNWESQDQAFLRQAGDPFD